LDTLEWVSHTLLAAVMEATEPARSTERRRSGLLILREIRRRSDPLGRSVFDASPWVPSLDTV
jgi:hypothetical protein